MELIPKGIWRVLACMAALSFALTAWKLRETRMELAEAQRTAAENEAAARSIKQSATIAEDMAVKQSRAATDTANAKAAATRTTNEAKHDDTYRAWADLPAPALAWRLLREAAPAGNGAHSAAAPALGAVPGNADTQKR